MGNCPHSGKEMIENVAPIDSSMFSLLTTLYLDNYLNIRSQKIASSEINNFVPIVTIFDHMYGLYTVP